MTVVVEPGVLVMELANAAIEKGVFYPPEPGEKTASIGGNVMTNAGGMKAVGYGVTRNYVVSMECVMPNGSVMQFGSNVAKNTSGYDIKDLVVGSEGTLCIATKLRMRVIPQPKASYTLLVPYGSLEECVGTVPKFINSTLNPTAIEYMPKSLLDEAAYYLNKIMPHKTANCYLILMFDGATVEDVERRCDEAAAICLENGAEDVFLCNTDERKEAVWTVRGASLEALKASTTDMDECDIVVPRNRIVDFSHFADTKMEEYGIRISIQGHAGDGNMHIQLMRDDMDPALFEERRPKLMTELYEQAKEMDGQVSGEHGIGHARVQALEHHMGPEMIALFRGIKAVFDDKNILNPGKVIR
jgi:glycolate oxidase